MGSTLADDFVSYLKLYESEFNSRIQVNSSVENANWIITKVEELTGNHPAFSSFLDGIYELFPESESILLLLIFYKTQVIETKSTESINQFLVDTFPIEFSSHAHQLLDTQRACLNEDTQCLISVNSFLLNNDITKAISTLLPFTNEDSSSPLTRLLLRLYEKSSRFNELNLWYLKHRDTCASEFVDVIFRQHLQGDLETKDYCLYLAKLIRYIEDDAELAVRIWQELFRYNFYETVELASYYRQFSSATKEKGYKTLLLYEDSDVPDPELSPEIIRGFAISEWTSSSSLDSILEPLKTTKQKRLYGKPCRLSQLRILALGIQASGTPISQLESKIEDVLANLCPLHSSSTQDAYDFLRQYLKKSSGTIQVVRRGAHAFLKLALESKRFMLSEESFSFLTRHETPLLSWQKAAIDSWAAHGRQGVVMAATGTGKSRLGIAAILEAREDSLPTVILSHRLAIKGQWKKDELQAIPGMRDIHGNTLSTREMIFRLGENVYELSSEDSPLDFYEIAEQSSPVLLALDKSLSKRMNNLPLSWSRRSLLVADEVHRFGESTGQKVLEGSFSRRMGLTATLSYGDSAILDAFGETVVADYPIGRAIADGVINEYNLLVVRGKVRDRKNVFGNEKVVLDLDSSDDYVSTQSLLDDALTRLDFAYNELITALKSQNYELNDDFEIELLRIIHNRVPELYKLAKRYLTYRTSYDRLARKTENSEGFLDIIAPKIAEHGNTLIFSNWRDQGRWIADKLLNLGVAIEYLDGDSDYSERNSAFERLSGLGEADSINAIVAPFILDEGVNIPRARIGVFMSNCPDGYRQIVQRMGRVLRKKGEGQKALLLLTVGIGTREDPGIEGVNFQWPDTMFKVMSEHASQVRICNIDDPGSILKNLDELLSE